MTLMQLLPSFQPLNTDSNKRAMNACINDRSIDSGRALEVIYDVDILCKIVHDTELQNDFISKYTLKMHLSQIIILYKCILFFRCIDR